MTGPQVFKKGLQNILESIPQLVDVTDNDAQWIEIQLCNQLPGFIPIHEELTHLAKHWLKMIIDKHWVWFFNEELAYCSPDLHLAKRRIERILECGVFFEPLEHPSRQMHQELPQFVCIRSELVELVKHLAEKAFRHQFSIVSGSFVSSSFIRSIDFLWNRVDRIREVLGDGEVENLINYVKSTLCAKDTAEDKGWDITFNGTKEQKEAYAKEYKRALRERKEPIL